MAERFAALTGSADALARYQARRPGGSLMEWLADVTSDHTFLWPAMRLAGAMAAQGASVQAYQFDWAPPASRFKACHCIELPFVFGNLDAWPGAGMLDGGDRHEMEGLSARVRRAWIDFVRDGSAGEDWPGYRQDERWTMRLGRVTEPALDPAGLRWRGRRMTRRMFACSVVCRMPGRHGSARRSKSPGTAHGTRRATGQIGPQPLSRLRMAMGDFDLPQSEDCLSLTIFAPEGAGPWPVILWLHGGAYLSGAGSLPWYDASALAGSGAVVVGVNYRLGPLGMLHVPGVARGDMLLQDIEAALTWVRANIAAFGGDPGCVTLMGQSAGAHAIMCLLCRGSRGFHRAVLLSPPPAWAPLVRGRGDGAWPPVRGRTRGGSTCSTSGTYAGGTGADAAGHGPVRGNPRAVPADGGRGEHGGGVHRADRAGGG